MVENTELIMKRLEHIEKSNLELRSDVADLKAEVGRLKEQVRELNVRMERQEASLTELRILCENELDGGIKIIAEGHATLMKRLNEVIGLQRDKVQIDLEINWLKMDMRKVKAKIGIA